MRRVNFLDVNSSYKAISTDLDERLKELLSYGHYIGGSAVKEFEEEWSSYCGANYAVGVGNGLDALTLALRALGVGEGDEVIVPSNTYIATWLAVTNNGAKVVPVEPNPLTYTIDAASISKKIGDRTKVILPVHLYGSAAPMDEIVSIAKEHNLYVVEDAAQAHGSALRGRKVGSHGDIVAWSFYPTKNLGAFGDAGAITTNDERLAAKIRLMGNYGSAQKYKNEMVGINSRLDSLQATVLSVKLKYLEDWNDRRITAANFYSHELKDLPIKLPSRDSNIHHVFHQFVIEYSQRERLMRFLKAYGVQTLIHYPIPPFEQKAYMNYGWDKTDFPIASKMSRNMISLPIDPLMKVEDRVYVVEKIKEFFASG